MRVNRLSISLAALLTAQLATALPGLAQAGRSWVDPPSALEAPRPAAPPAEPPAQAPAPEPSPPRPDPAPPPSAQQTTPPPASAPAVAAQPEAPDTTSTARVRAAKAFTVRYLGSWSAPNEAALDDTAEFYAPRVLFHGRTISMKRLFDQKRRFVRRWPERDYRPREDSIGVACNPQNTLCTVHAVFDFTAANPERRRMSQGSGALQLVVEFIGEKPIIVAEHSSLLAQDRRRSLALEGSTP